MPSTFIEDSNFGQKRKKSRILKILLWTGLGVLGCVLIVVLLIFWIRRPCESKRETLLSSASPSNYSNQPLTQRDSHVQNQIQIEAKVKKDATLEKATRSSSLLSSNFDLVNLDTSIFVPANANIGQGRYKNYQFGVDSQTKAAWFTIHKFKEFTKAPERDYFNEALTETAQEFGEWNENVVAELHGFSDSGKKLAPLTFDGVRIFLNGPLALVVNTCPSIRRFSILKLTDLVAKKLHDASWSPKCNQDLPFREGKIYKPSLDTVWVTPKNMLDENYNNYRLFYCCFHLFKDGSFWFAYRTGFGSFDYFRHFPSTGKTMSMSNIFGLFNTSFVENTGERVSFDLNPFYEKRKNKNNGLLEISTCMVNNEDMQSTLPSSEKRQGLMVVDSITWTEILGPVLNPSMPLAALFLVKEISFDSTDMKRLEPHELVLIDYRAKKQTAHKSRKAILNWCQDLRDKKRFVKQLAWVNHETLLVFIETIKEPPKTEDVLIEGVTEVWQIKIATKDGEVESEKIEQISSIPCLFQFIQLQTYSNTIHFGGIKLAMRCEFDTLFKCFYRKSIEKHLAHGIIRTTAKKGS